MKEDVVISVPAKIRRQMAVALGRNLHAARTTARSQENTIAIKASTEHRDFASFLINTEKA